jgi:hypothetical protein
MHGQHNLKKKVEGVTNIGKIYKFCYGKAFVQGEVTM